MSLTIFIEGGGDSEELHSECRDAFKSFIEKAFKNTDIEWKKPRIVFDIEVPEADAKGIMTLFGIPTTEIQKKF